MQLRCRKGMTMIRYRVYTRTGKAGAVKIDRDFDTYQEAWDRMCAFLEQYRDTDGFENAVKLTYINEIVRFSEEGQSVCEG